jgi:hypothetical protein
MAVMNRVACLGLVGNGRNIAESTPINEKLGKGHDETVAMECP